MVEFPPYRFDLRQGRLWRDSDPVDLRPKAWTLLQYLVERPGVLVTKEEMHRAIWGDAIVSDDTLTHTLAELRRALRDDPRTPRIIETVHRRGVRFIARLHGSPAGDPAAESRVAHELATEGDAGLVVGREAEVDRLRALFRRASAGQRQVVFVQGEAGIGKSTILDAFLRTLQVASDPVLIGHGQCLEQHGEREPYMPVLEAVERLGRGPSGNRLLPALRAVAPSWLARMPSLQRPVDAERLRRWQSDTTPQRMLRELAGLVETISIDQPVVLVLEDLHWSDQATVDLVSMLAQRPERARAMLVGTYRPAQVAAQDHPIQQVVTLLRARGRSTEIAVEYLGRRDVATYLERRLHGSRVAEEVPAAIHAHTDGNPLFMTLLVDDLLARGWLARDGEGWRLTVPRSTIGREVPDNIRQLIESQLRFLSTAERDVLEVASVAGVAFDAPAVAVGLGAEPAEIESICHRLSGASRWLQFLGSRAWPDGTLAARYAFRHGLYRVALYDRFPPSRRLALHQRIGERIEAGYAGRTAEVSSELARHFEGSRDQRRALTYLEQAATRAYDRRAYRDVIACLEPALRLVDEQPDTPERARDELRMRRLCSVALSQTAGYTAESLLENLGRMEALCDRLGDSATLFDVLAAMCLDRAAGGRLVEAAEVGRRLAGLSERLDASAALHSAWLQGAVDVWMGDLAAAGPRLARAIASPVSLEDADRPYGVNPLVAARSHESLRRWAAGDPGGARSVQQEALALAERHGAPFTLAHAATHGAFVLLLDEDWAGAERLAGRATELAEDYGFVLWRGTALVAHGGALVGVGERDRGLARIREGLDARQRAGLLLGSSLLLSFLAQACLRLDRLDEGLAATATGLAHCRDTGERFFEAELWRLRGELLRRCKDPDAEACLDKARAVAHAQGAHMLERRAGRRAARVAPARQASRS